MRRDGRVEMRFETTGRKQVIRWILSWMPDVKVLAPKSLRDGVEITYRHYVVQNPLVASAEADVIRARIAGDSISTTEEGTPVPVRPACRPKNRAHRPAPDSPAVPEGPRDDDGWIAKDQAEAVLMDAWQVLPTVRSLSRPFWGVNLRKSLGWSGRRESNPCDQLGRLEFYH